MTDPASTDLPSGDPPHYFECHVFVCTNKRPDGHERGSCADGGSVALQNYLKQKAKEAGLKGRVRINNAGCLDRCELGPVLVMYPEGVWYAYRSKADLDEIFDRHVQQGQRVNRLILTPEHGP